MLALFLMLVVPDAAAMASPRWEVRAAATARLKGTWRGTLLAVLPHGDPEVQMRMRIVCPRDPGLELAAAWTLSQSGCVPYRESHWWADRPDRLAALERAGAMLGLFDPAREVPAWRTWDGTDQFQAAQYPFARSVESFVGQCRGRACVRLVVAAVKRGL